MQSEDFVRPHLVSGITTHSQLQTAVINACLEYHFHVHTCDARIGTSTGFPDLVIITNTGVLWRELKVPPDTLRPAQKAVMYRLLAIKENWAIWTPADWESGRVRSELERAS